jgi:mono/diheme cytochrome c family protein
MKLFTISIAALAACGSSTADVSRGKQLVAMGGCADCHTPKAFDPKLGMPVPDMTRFLAGHPEGAPDPQAQPGQTDMAVIGPTFTSFKTGFGVVYARNLTPDKETGLGAWTADQFIQMMRTGHRQGTGRVLLLPMPWMNLAHSSDEDLRAIFAYLQSLPPVHNAVPDPKVPPPAMAAIEDSYKKVQL